MPLCFVDESDQGDFHGFAGLMADEYATTAITASLTRIMRLISVDWDVPATTEFHGHPIFHARQVWNHVPTRVRVGVLHKVFDAVVAQDVVILAAREMARPWETPTGSGRVHHDGSRP